MKTRKEKLTICSRGHKFYKSTAQPTCPICWPGRYQKNKKKSAGKKYTHYHKDGSIWAKGSTKGGKMEGYWEWFRKEGTKMRSGHFKAGKQTGEWTTYDRKGKVYKITHFS